jgi:hypothetical protein
VVFLTDFLFITVSILKMENANDMLNQKIFK